MSTTLIDIGIRELQRDTSRLVRDVEQTGNAYRVTLQGRPTRVVLARGASVSGGTSVEALRNSPLYKQKHAAVLQAQLAELERSRNAAGTIAS